MVVSGKHPLTGLLHVDELVTGGPLLGKPGRRVDTKKKTFEAPNANTA